jgi:hypothetical protein
VLKAAGIAFPEGADAMLKDGKLTVRNTKANLDLIEGWLDALPKAEIKKQTRLTVQAVEMTGDFLKQLNDWLPPLPGKIENEWAPAESNLTPPPEVLRQFSLGGVFTPAQLEIVAKRLADSGAKLETLKPNKKPQMYDLPAALGGGEIKAEPVIGPDGRTIDLIVHTPSHDPNASKGLSTTVTIWEGQTIVLGAQPSADLSRLLFITVAIEKSGE